MITTKNYEIWFLDYLEDKLSDEETAQLQLFLVENPLLAKELEELSLINISTNQTEFSKFPNKADLKKELTIISDKDELIIASLENDIKIEGKIDLQLKNDNDFIAYQKSKLTNSPISFPHKNELRSDKYNLEDIDHLILSYMDGTISSTDQDWLKGQFSDQGLKKQISLFEKTSLVPDNSILYPFKDELKKKEKTTIFYLPWIRVASSIAASLLLMIAIYQVLDIDNSNIELVEPTANLDNNDYLSNDVAIATKEDKTKPIKNTHNDNYAASREIKAPKQLNNNKFLSNNAFKNTRKINATSIANNDNHLSSTINTIVSNNKNPQNNVVKNNFLSLTYKPRVTDSIQLIKTRIVENIQPLSPTNIYINTHRSKVAPNIKLEPIQLLENTIAGIERSEDGDNKFDLGIFEIEIPALLIASIEAVKSTKDKYDESISTDRSKYSFSLGGISFYRSSKKN